MLQGYFAVVQQGTTLMPTTHIKPVGHGLEEHGSGRYSFCIRHETMGETEIH